MSNTPSESMVTRRGALRKMLLISAATCAALLGGSSIIGSISKAKSQRITNGAQAKTAIITQTLNNTSSASTSAVSISSISSAHAPSNYTIKVAYFGFLMVQITGTTEEYLTLPAPVFLEDVVSKISEEHVVLPTMLPLMSIVVNGLPADGNPQLANNSEVDLIPTYAGG